MEDTVLVAARVAWPEYLKYGAYICQPGRSFRAVKYMAFYTANEIQPQVAQIIEDPLDRVVFQRGKYSGLLGELVDRVVKDGVREDGLIQKVFLLSKAESSDTVELGTHIKNDQRSSKGRLTAFTFGHRYVNLADLQRVARLTDADRTTSRLLRS